jgi:hypothetical protein
MSITVASLATGAILGASWLLAIQPLLNALQQTSYYPTAIPWLQTQADCQHTGRAWREGTCWDEQHNPNF